MPSFRFIAPRKFFITALCGLATGVLMACSEPQSSVNTADIRETTASDRSQLKGEPVRFGVLSIDSAVSVNERYRPLLDYLEAELERPFELISLTQESQFTEVEAGNLDFTTNNPLAAVQIRRLHDTEFLVTHSRPKTGPQFSGLIVVRADSEIKTLEHLRGKRVSCVNFQTAAAGCVFQIYHLQQNGIDPARDFADFTENKSQDSIVLAVINGTIDAGFIRTGQLEKMVGKELIPNVNVLRVLAPVDDNFLYTHTTALYPEWPIAALPQTDSELAEQVREALLNIPPDHPSLKPAKVEGFIPTVSYDDLDSLVETLKLKSWDSK
ncbi:MAG: phosphate/phosphite/phosphonate ABC transporter substrate-binding protein [Cyanobacteria bacterium SBLK]|nr:phosphate/phosphite/phosphonate ABC transporter substrate-binding protein [Cyanobacteria bacterium SBLK]